MDIPIPADSASESSASSATTTDEKSSADVVLGDPLANMKLDDSTNLNVGANPQIVANETLDTSDQSVVGEFAKIKAQKKASGNLDSLTAFMAPSEPKPEEKAPEKSEPETPEIPKIEVPKIEPVDPEKEVFIKTYTEEFDQTVRRATEAAGEILKAIDATIREHLPEIAIAKTADEFLENPPEDQKVGKFDDAQEIVRTIMTKANEAKAQSTAAAAEAAKVYDEVQEFKKSTKEQITTLTDGLDLAELKKQAENEKYSHAEKAETDSDFAKNADGKSGFIKDLKNVAHGKAA